MKQPLVFLKLGGSLITDKSLAHTANLQIIRQIAMEIKEYRDSHPELKLLLGHGSGSFGHFPAAKYRTKDGVSRPEDWAGFLEVWREARSLNCIIMDELLAAGLPAITFSPCSQVRTHNKKITRWDTSWIETALSRELIPVIHGDTIFDDQLGGTILSTETLFAFLASRIHPDKILIAGIEEGIWEDFPARTRHIKQVTPESVSEIDKILAGSENLDVTGGMRSKVYELCQLVEQGACSEAVIFSGNTAGNLLKALSGQRIGTSIVAGGKE